jgi:hypothetical protein
MVMKSVKVLAHKPVHPDTPANKVLKAVRVPSVQIELCTVKTRRSAVRVYTPTDVYLCGCC